VPVNRKNRQICSRLKHCSSNFHKTMHKVIHLYGKTYGKNRPPIFLLERSTQSREGERGGRLTGGGSHGGEGGGPALINRPEEEGEPGTAAGGAGATAAATGVEWEERTHAGEERRAVALTPLRALNLTHARSGSAAEPRPAVPV
jgi:hypothetical protein